MKKKSRRKKYKQHSRLGNKGRKEECNNFFSKIIKHFPRLHDSSHRLVYFCYSGNQVSLESSNTSQGGKSVWGAEIRFKCFSYFQSSRYTNIYIKIENIYINTIYIKIYLYIYKILRSLSWMH